MGGGWLALSLVRFGLAAVMSPATFDALMVRARWRR